MRADGLESWFFPYPGRYYLKAMTRLNKAGFSFMYRHNKVTLGASQNSLELSALSALILEQLARITSRNKKLYRATKGPYYTT